jgi:hypothetical protein
VWARESKLKIDFGPGYRVYFTIDIDTVDVRVLLPEVTGKFDYKYIGVNVGNIPLVGTGKPDHEVFELHLDEFIYSRYLRFHA